MNLISKFQVVLKSLLCQELLEPESYGDLVYKLKKFVDSNNFSGQFVKIISHSKNIDYNFDVLQQTACLVVNPIMIGNFVLLFICTLVTWTSNLKDLSIDETGSDAFGCCQAHPGIPVGFLLSGIQFYVLLNISWLCLLFILIYMF